MAKRRVTETQKERRRVLRQITAMEKRGYRFPENLREEIKSAKYYATIHSYRNKDYKKLYGLASAEVDGKIVTGPEKRTAERKESAEKAVQTRQRKPKASDVVWKEAPSLEELEDQLYDKTVGSLSDKQFEEWIRKQKDARDLMTVGDIREGELMLDNIDELIKRFDTRTGGKILQKALAKEIEKYGRNKVAEAMANAPGDVIAEAQNIVFYSGDKEANHKALVNFFDSIIGEVRTLSADKALGEALDRMTDFYVP